MITPLLPGYVVSKGESLTFAGMAVGAFSIAALLARPLASITGDRFNKKWLYIFSLCLTGFSIVLYTLVPGVVWLLPVRIFHGLAFSISGTVFFSLGVGFIPQKRLGEGIGYLGLGNIIGNALGPNIAIILIQHYSYEFCFLLSGIVIMAAGLSVIALRYSHTAVEPSPGCVRPAFSFHNLLSVELLPNALFCAILAVSQGLIISFLVMLGLERGITNIGLYFIVNCVFLAATRPFLGRIADRIGSAAVVLPGFILSAAAMMLIGMSNIIWPLLLAAFFMAIGSGGAMPAIQADCLKKLSRGRETLATGTYFIGMDTGMTIGQVLGGALIDFRGYGVTFNSAGFLSLAGFFIFLLYSKFEKRRKGFY